MFRKHYIKVLDWKRQKNKYILRRGIDMTNWIIIIILLIIIGSATGYIVKEKKRGVKCIGCPAGGNCKSCRGNFESTYEGHFNIKEENGKG